MKQLILISLWFFSLVSTWAQSNYEGEYSVQQEYFESSIEKTEVNEKTWRKATKNLDYPTRQVKTRRLGNSSPSGKLGGDGRIFFTIFIIVLVAALIAFAIAYFTGNINMSKRKKSNKNISIADIENNIFETDLEAMIRQALSQQDYKLAIRLYFLSILKELSLQKKIRWKKDKTNRAYSLELGNTPLYLSFQKLALIFDRIRYGGDDLDQLGFKEIEPEFTSFIRNLNPQLLGKISHE